MALYIEFHNGESTWHVGEPQIELAKRRLDQILWIQADGVSWNWLSINSISQSRVASAQYSDGMAILLAPSCLP